MIHGLKSNAVNKYFGTQTLVVVVVVDVEWDGGGTLENMEHFSAILKKYHIFDSSVALFHFLNLGVFLENVTT